MLVSRSGFNQTRFALGVRRSRTNLATIRIESVSAHTKPDRTGAKYNSQHVETAEQQNPIAAE